MEGTPLRGGPLLRPQRCCRMLKMEVATKKREVRMMDSGAGRRPGLLLTLATRLDERARNKEKIVVEVTCDRKTSRVLDKRGADRPRGRGNRLAAQGSAWRRPGKHERDALEEVAVTRVSPSRTIVRVVLGELTSCRPWAKESDQTTTSSSGTSRRRQPRRPISREMTVRTARGRGASVSPTRK